jgi:hypothetical protein
LEYVKRWEDCYSGALYESFEEFWEEFESVLGPRSPWADLNWPVWVHVDDDQETGAPELTMGVFKPRHGECTVWVLPNVTPEQERQIRDAVSEVWIGRVDVGCQRWNRSSFGTMAMDLTFEAAAP